jgi:hypothetical protein
MGIRQITGYIAHILLALYWLWMISSTAPQLRRSSRDRGLRVRIVLVKTAAIVLTALVVGVIHFWATQWWQVVGAPVVAGLAGLLLRRAYRTLVAAPRHRATLTQRARTFERRFVGPQSEGTAPTAALRSDLWTPTTSPSTGPTGTSEPLHMPHRRDTPATGS